MERLRYAPSMPHCRPMMKQSDQITIVDPTIRTPAWRSASPKYRKTRSRKISPKTRPENLTMSPNEATQSRGTAIQPGTRRPPRSLDHADLWVGGEQGLGEDVVEREDAEEGDHDGLVDRSADPFRAPGRGHALVGADDRDDRPEQGRLDDRPPQVDRRGVRQQGREERPQRRPERERGEHAAEDAEQKRVDVEQRRHDHQ